MTFPELLRAIRSDSALGRELLKRVTSIARRLPRNRSDDGVARTVLVLLEIAAGHRSVNIDDVSEGYVAAMLDNWHTSELRKLKRARDHLEIESAVARSEPPSDLVSFEELQSVIERVTREAVEGIEKEGRLELDLGAMWALSSGTVTMNELISSELRSSADAGSPPWVRARDRLFKRHQRARNALAEAIERMVKRGDLSREEGNLTKRFLDETLKRRGQKKESGASSARGEIS